MTTILCIDDEEEIRRNLASELLDEGYEVLEAENGRQALQKMRERKPDLVLCDISMPMMDGRQLLSEVRESLPQMSDVPFIFLTGLADRKDIIVSKKLGADDYLQKPVDYGILIATIESRLNQVERIASKQDQRLVKLYKSLNAASVPAAVKNVPKKPDGPMNVISVTNHEVDFEKVHGVLRANGHTVVEMESGKIFLDVYPALSLNLCLLSLNTADLQGAMVLHYMKEIRSAGLKLT